MNSIKPLDGEVESISLVKLKPVIRLRVDIDAYNLESSLGVASSGATSTAKQIQQQRLIQLDCLLTKVGTIHPRKYQAGNRRGGAHPHCQGSSLVASSVHPWLLL